MKGDIVHSLTVLAFLYGITCKILDLYRRLGYSCTRTTCLYAWYLNGKSWCWQRCEPMLLTYLCTMAEGVLRTWIQVTIAAIFHWLEDMFKCLASSLRSWFIGRYCRIPCITASTYLLLRHPSALPGLQHWFCISEWSSLSLLGKSLEIVHRTVEWI